jgi:hypothetical protein
MSFATDDQRLPEDDSKPLDVNECLNALKDEIKKLFISGNFSDLPTDAQEMWRYFFPVAATLPASLTGSKIGGSFYGPTAETVLTLKKRTAAGVVTTIGTFTYAQTTGAVTVAFTAAVSFAAGDALMICNQATKDVSAQGFAWTFLATRN